MNHEQHNAPALAPSLGNLVSIAPDLSRSAVMWWDGGERAITAREKALIEEHSASSFSIPLVPAPTPGARWMADGQDDPHGQHYDCERASLALGHYTDDELANAVFLHGNVAPSVAALAAGESLPSIAYLTAAKDRIRWLSRSLADALASGQPVMRSVDAASASPGITRYRIEDAPRLDPITVYVENVEPGKGRMVVTCYASAWTVFWGAMGAGNTLEEFVANCNPEYVADNMVWGTDASKSARQHADKVAVAVVALFKSQRKAAPGVVNA